MSQSFSLSIVCLHPHGDRSATFSFPSRPSVEEIFTTIRRLRGRAVNDGVVGLVKIEAVGLRKIETTEYNCVNLDQVNGELAPLVYTSKIDDRLL